MEYNDCNKRIGDKTVLILSQCEILKESIPCDFVGLALQNKGGPDIKWPYAVGNRNDKHKYITVRFGKGIAGKVISSGSPMEILKFPNNILGKSTEYPIMLAEQLISVFSVPVLWNGSPKGALLIGFRKEHKFNENMYTQVKKIAREIEFVLPKHFDEI